MEKLEWRDYLTANNSKICLLVLTEYTKVTDGQTPHGGIEKLSSLKQHIAELKQQKSSSIPTLSSHAAEVGLTSPF